MSTPVSDSPVPRTVWQEVECGGYGADLPLWEGLAAAAPGPVLELGCGTGRVSLHLARRGHDVWGLDEDPDMVERLRERAGEQGVTLRVARGDARRLALRGRFGLIVAPLQLLQIVGGAGERAGLLRGCAAHLAPGGRFAAAIVEAPPASSMGGEAILPDVREDGGWLYSSRPLEVVTEPGSLRVRRLRQAVSPRGELHEIEHTDRLALLDPTLLETEAAAAGLVPMRRITVEPADRWASSTIVVCGVA